MLRAGISIYNKIKNKDIRGAVEETKQAIEQIKDIKEDLKNGQVQDNQD